MVEKKSNEGMTLADWYMHFENQSTKEIQDTINGYDLLDLKIKQEFASLGWVIRGCEGIIQRREIERKELYNVGILERRG